MTPEEQKAGFTYKGKRIGDALDILRENMFSELFPAVSLILRDEINTLFDGSPVCENCNRVATEADDEGVDLCKPCYAALVDEE